MSINELALARFLAKQAALSKQIDSGKTTSTLTRSVDSAKVASKPVFVQELTAKEFLEALRNAGVREVSSPDGKVIKQRIKDNVRKDQIAAINKYVGYNNQDNLGSQLMNAEAKAKREMSAQPAYDGPSRQEQRRLNASVAGYVSGVPDAVQRRLNDLLTRERLIVEKMCELEDKCVKSADASMRLQLKGEANVERERLEHVRKQIEQLK